MEHDELRHLLKQRPFQPFRVFLRDGRIFDIRYPYMNLLAPTFIKIGIPESDGTHPMCDHTEYVRLTEIDRAEFLSSTVPPVAS